MIKRNRDRKWKRDREGNRDREGEGDDFREMKK